jgi:hypothetical protein
LLLLLKLLKPLPILAAAFLISLYLRLVPALRNKLKISRHAERSAAQSKHLYRLVERSTNGAIEMLRLRCAPLSMTDAF